MADNSVDAIVTDPPYFKVKGEAWDHQWDKPAQFIEWIGELCVEWKRILRPNGSLYCFASPKMAARVEVKIGEFFNVLNSIRWEKPLDNSERRHAAQIVDKDLCRTFYPSGERIVFAEHFGADVAATEGEKGFVFDALLRYMIEQFETSGLTRREVDAHFGTANVSQYWLQARGFIIPTAEKWAGLRALRPNHFCRHYSDVLQYYEALYAEYEELRRPFNVTPEVPYTDVWTFPAVQAYPGKHVCEKPLALMEHIIRSSTRPGAVVLDCFSGSAATGHACVNLGRDFIGIELCERWAATGRRRLDLASSGVKSRRIGAIVPDAAEVKRQLGLFA